MSTGKQLDNPLCLEAIADLVKTTLTCLMRDPQEDDFKIFYTIVESSGNLFVVLNGTRKHYLWGMLNGHPIWANTKYWKQCAVNIINMKIDEAKKRQMIKASNNSQDEIQYIDTMSGEYKKNNIFKKGLTSFKGLFGGSKQPPPQLNTA